MPLPSASKLYFRHPKPETPEQHAANLQQQAVWSERLPFFGPSAEYHVYSTAGTSTAATGISNPITGGFTDYTTGAAFPYSGGPFDLYFPYQKQESWTSIRVDIHFSLYGSGVYLAAFNRMAVTFLRVLAMEELTATPSTKQQVPSDRPGFPYGYRGLREFFINPAGVHLPISDTIIIPPHERGTWVLQPHWYLFGGAGTIAMDANDRMRVVITECLPTLPPYAGEVP